MNGCRSCSQTPVNATPHQRVRHAIRHFGGDRSGSTLVEAALVLLVVVPLFFGLAELSEALTLQRRVETAAATAADLVTRSTEGGEAIGDAELRALPEILKMIVQTGPDTVGDVGFRIEIFNVVDKKDGSRSAEPAGSYVCGITESGTDTVPAAVKLVVEQTQDLERLVSVETQYGYASNFRYFIDTITLRGESFFAPRVGNVIKLPESGSCPVEE